MKKPCDHAPSYTDLNICELCMAQYTMNELRKIKDELKLVKVRLGQDKESANYYGWIEYGLSDQHPKIHYARDPNHT